jgi:hypothetical protein
MISGLASPTAFAQSRTKLPVYSTLEPAITEFKRAFEQDNPDIEIVWIRDRTKHVSWITLRMYHGGVA